MQANTKYSDPDTIDESVSSQREGVLSVDSDLASGPLLGFDESHIKVSESRLASISEVVKKHEEQLNMVQDKRKRSNSPINSINLTQIKKSKPGTSKSVPGIPSTSKKLKEKFNIGASNSEEECANKLSNKSKNVQNKTSSKKRTLKEISKSDTTIRNKITTKNKNYFYEEKIVWDKNKRDKVINRPTCTEVSKRKSEYDFIDYSYKGNSFMNFFHNFQKGIFKPSRLKEIAEYICIRRIKWINVVAREETSDLRVTALQWHPTIPHIFILGGKAGSLIAFSVKKGLITDFRQGTPLSFPGVGPGGTIEAIRFDTKASGINVYTASVDGTIASYDFEHITRKTLIESDSPYTKWFCSVDIHQDSKSVYGGDNVGNLFIHHLDSGKTESANSKLKLHSSKIRHLEFSPRDPNIMVTASLDKSVKLWDVRKLDGKNSYIHNLSHEFGVSAAKFSLTDGCRLLTTDLQSELRVYKAPLWTLEHQIIHPHRHFQHLTVIRASWHPLADLFVIGRYPDPHLKCDLDNLRSVDVFSASTGRLVHEFTDTSSLITSLSQFNATGDYLASTCGKTVYLWKNCQNNPL